MSAMPDNIGFHFLHGLPKFSSFRAPSDRFLWIHIYVMPLAQTISLHVGKILPHLPIPLRRRVWPSCRGVPAPRPQLWPPLSS
jgi:hypothetical protein